MGELTIDPNDPRLGHGADSSPVPQNEVYLVLSEEERSKGFVRPVRHSYRHVGLSGPKHPLRDLTPEEAERYSKYGYLKYEEYPKPNADGSSVCGKFWTQRDIDKIGKGCGYVTSMGDALAETYSRKPTYYGTTYCCGCSMHLPVAEFIWMTEDGKDTDQIVGS